MQIKPARIIALSFLIAIFFGVLFLLLPVSTEGEIAFIDALFTATSAVCVTGLVVQNTGAFFTSFGQGVILVLFQLGGLGIMAFSTIFALMLGKRITIRGRRALSVVFENVEIDVKVLLKWIFVCTVLMEALGAVILNFYWRDLGFFNALFHSVSAFCNAGFSLFPMSLQDARSSILINAVFILLIVSGGIGFLVLYDLGRLLKHKIIKKDMRLTLHSKMVLIITIALFILGAVFLFISENQGVLEGTTLNSKVLAACFQSVTARTAGFNTVEIAKLNPGSKMLLSMLMFVGASPGSTGGGVKTVTFGLIILGIVAILRGKNQIRFFNRAIPLKLFEKAVVIFTLSILWIFFAVLVLFFTEQQNALHIIFEVISAFGTVGLSCGITAQLTIIGKLIIILTMFFGRIGPMTLAIALARRETGDFKLPEENVMVG
ncbi:MAG: potassium transporter TrkG [Candidatus Saelkia tenebricola]|nr:potassium transporter TrkG [Candidatus Saelkia tenebricola]